MKNRKFKIGDKVLFEGIEHTIVAYFKENPCVHYVIKGPKGIHSGTLDEAILEDGSHYCPIIKSYDHIYVGENELTLIERKNMQKGVVKLSLEDAKKLYNEGGQFRTIALSAYSEDELGFIPKDGDFVYVQLHCGSSYIFIKNDEEVLTSKYISFNNEFKELSSQCYNCCFNEEIKEIRLATKKEKQIILNAMHEEGKDWDSVNKKIIPYRWRAKSNKNYYYIQTPSAGSAFVASSIEDNGTVDNARYENHNYFKTKEEAQKVADKINYIFEEL